MAAPRLAVFLSRAYPLVRIALGLVFVVAGVLKMGDPRGFARVIAGYGLLPNGFSGLAALALPWLEVLAGAALVLDIRAGLSSVAGMLAGFMAVLAYGLHMGLDVDCGCFAPTDHEATAYHGMTEALARDAAMLAACAFLHVCRRVLGIAASRPGAFCRHLFTRIKENQSWAN